jgi:hypothetical protein
LVVTNSFIYLNHKTDRYEKVPTKRPNERLLPTQLLRSSNDCNDRLYAFGRSNTSDLVSLFLVKGRDGRNVVPFFVLKRIKKIVI